MTRTQRGFTLIEILGALAIVAVAGVGMTALINDSVEDSKGQQTALYQSQFAAAAAKYIAANYSTLQSTATSTTPVMFRLSDLTAGNFLPSSFGTTNPYGQTPCVLVLQPSAGRLEALAVTEGGTDIPTKNLSFIAANSGQGGGFISPSAATVAQGTYQAWQLTLANYTQKTCSGTKAAKNHLASAIFFDGPGNLATDFLYRNTVTGHPELNSMNVPLNMRAVVTQETSDANCVVGDSSTFGRIAVDATGAVLSCQAGVWKRSGSWKDPVATFALLPSSGTNAVGDVRMVTSLGRAFSWNGTGWVALAVDQNGNLTVPQTLTANSVSTNTVSLTQTFVKNTACSPNGMLGRDATGMVLSCQSGKWRNSMDTTLTTVAYDQFYKNMSSAGVADYYIDIPSLPGNHPLYMTGYSFCQSSGSTRTFVHVTWTDASDNLIAYAGECGTRSDNTGGRVMIKTGFGLQKIPENVKTMQIHLEPSTDDPNDYAETHVTIFNSQ